jgi:large subunit ribosomal protein L29
MRAKKYLDTLYDKTVEELSVELTNTKKELFNLRFQNATNQLDNTARIREVRKNIARIQTIITQRTRGIVPQGR